MKKGKTRKSRGRGEKEKKATAGGKMNYHLKSAPQEKGNRGSVARRGSEKTEVVTFGEKASRGEGRRRPP